MNKNIERMASLIIGMMEQENNLIWEKDWKITKFPCNGITSWRYSGINALLLTYVQQRYFYQSTKWYTFRQIQKAGGKVRKGEKATPVCFWKIIEKEGNNPDEEIKIPFLNVYMVFNLEQTEGMKVENNVQNNGIEHRGADEIIQNYLDAEQVNLAYGKPSYAFELDRIMMPRMEEFYNKESYLKTFFHEIIHSTGHKNRLNRTDLLREAASNEEYSREEITAEMGSCFLRMFAGIESERENKRSAAYIKGWLEYLKDHKAELVQGVFRAQKAADYVMQYSMSE